MPDPRFFLTAAPLRLDEAARLAGFALPEGADGACEIHAAAPIGLAGPGDVTFLTDPKRLDDLAASRASLCLISPRLAERACVPEETVLVVSDNAHAAFTALARRLHPAPPLVPGIDPSARIDESAEIGQGCEIGPFVVIGAGAKIGAGSRLGAGVVIGPGCEIGTRAVIGPQVSIGHTLAGERLVVREGARIGGQGFGFLPGAGGLEQVPQLGRVIIGEDVHVGANTIIDRGAGDDTVIGQGTKIDSLVMIAHNCRIGAHCVLAGQAGVAGSATLGDGVMLGGKVAVSDHITIGAGARLAGGAGAMRDIPAGAVQGGRPSQDIRAWHRSMLALARLGEVKGRGGESP